MQSFFFFLIIDIPNIIMITNETRYSVQLNNMCIINFKRQTIMEPHKKWWGDSLKPDPKLTHGQRRWAFHGADCDFGYVIKNRFKTQNILGEGYFWYLTHPVGEFIEVGSLLVKWYLD